MGRTRPVAAAFPVALISGGSGRPAWNWKPSVTRIIALSPSPTQMRTFRNSDLFDAGTSRSGSSEYEKPWNHCLCDILRVANMERHLNGLITMQSCTDIPSAQELRSQLLQQGVPALVVAQCAKHGAMVISCSAVSPPSPFDMSRVMSPRKWSGKGTRS